jgi:hypothetical protein
MFPDSPPAIECQFQQNSLSFKDLYGPILLDASAHAKFFEIPNRKMLVTEPASPTKSTGLLPKRSELQEGLNTDRHTSGKRDKQSTPLKDGAALS